MREAETLGIGANELHRNNEPGVRVGATQGIVQLTFTVRPQQ